MTREQEYKSQKNAAPGHHALSPAIRIGKDGVTENVIKQIKHILKKNKVIKVKFLPSAVGTDKRAQAQKLAKDTGTLLVHRVGFVVVLRRQTPGKENTAPTLGRRKS